MNRNTPRPQEEIPGAQAVPTQHVRYAEALLQSSPRKGFVYEDAMHPILEAIAAGFGDDYVDTSKTPGFLPKCTKGDGLLIVTDWPGLPPEGARVVFEMSDSDTSTRRWNPYLEESERNRGAHTSVGLVRYREQVPRRKDTRVYGSRRIVVAFDPEADDPGDLLSTVIILARNRAIFDAVRSVTGSPVDASENLTDAQRLVDELPDIRMLMAKIRTIADQAVNRVDSVHLRLDRSLSKLADALDDKSNSQTSMKKFRELFRIYEIVRHSGRRRGDNFQRSRPVCRPICKGYAVG